MTPTGNKLAALIDHTLLKAEATQADIERLCDEARTHGFYSVCVNPIWVPLAARLLAGSSTIPITVVGFPLGASCPESKAFEAGLSVEQGAQEIDMVIALGALKSGDLRHTEEDIRQVVEASDPHPVKVILEIASLTPAEIQTGCELAVKAGAAFVKTSTGFGSGGATVEAVRLMRQVVGPTIGVKASGGIRGYADAQRMIEAGATRIGASSGIRILEESLKESNQSESSDAPPPASGKVGTPGSNY